MTNVNHIIDDPNYLAYKLDFTTESVEFLMLADGDLNRATWLTRDELGIGATSVSVPLADVVLFFNSQPKPMGKSPRFIFHTAYCASTFLSRCLDISGLSVSLREPQILLDAANAKRLQWRSKTCNIDFRHLPAMALRLLQKHAKPHEALIIKPINSVNNIIPELMHAGGGSSRALMLYTDARRFLLSTLNKGETAKQRQRSMFDLLRCDFPHLSQLGVSNVIHLSDLKICLTLWRLQLEQAEQVLTHVSNKAVIKSLYAETLINDPTAALYAVNTFFELDIPSESIDGIASSDVGTQDAKNTNNDFSISKRAASNQKTEEFYGADLANGYNWLVTNNPTTSLTPTLSSPLET